MLAALLPCLNVCGRVLCESRRVRALPAGGVHAVQDHLHPHPQQLLGEHDLPVHERRVQVSSEFSPNPLNFSIVWSVAQRHHVIILLLCTYLLVWISYVCTHRLKVRYADAEPVLNLLLFGLAGRAALSGIARQSFTTWMLAPSILLWSF